MTLSAKSRSLIALCVAALLGLAAVVIAESNAASGQAANGFQGTRVELNRDLASAQQQGYGADDLRPVLERVAALDSAPAPVWIGDRPGFYRQQALTAGQLRAQLRLRLQGLLVETKTKALSDLAAAKTQIDHDTSIGVDPGDVGPLQGRYDELARVLGGGATLTDFRGASAGARTLGDDAAKAGTQQEAENAVLAAAGQDLKSQKAGSLPAIARAGAEALASGRNEATYAGFLNQAGGFTGYATLARAYRGLERYAAQASSPDLDKAAVAAAAELRYTGQIHDALVAGMPGKAILVSLSDQQLRAYEQGHSQPVLDTVITSGRPALPTDVGPMKVLWKASPWKMVSPWPQGSPYYYAPTDVRKVLWFTNSGEGLHDASWRSWFGPGSNSGDGTHGCVNMPGRTVDFVYDWAPVGTPVIVIPGNGQPLDQQLAADTIDSPAAQTVKGA